jgi:uncharacterized protein (TIGR00251 family)
MLRLRVSPGARRSEFLGPHGDAWKVRVAAPAEGGRANEAVLTLVAETLDLPRRDVSLVSGRTARDKVVAIAGLGEAEAVRRLGRTG